MDFYTHYKCIGHVIIPKPHCSSREGINFHCRRFDWLIFAGQSVRLSITAVDSAPTGRWPFNHSTVTALLPAPLVHSTAKCARVGFRDSYGCFSRIKKMLVGQSEMRTRDRMYCQTIRKVGDISRDGRARIATCRLQTPTDLGEL